MAVNSFNAQNPPVTTKGDLFTFSTIPTRLGVGANNTVLTADSATATGLKWAAPASGGITGWSLLNTGGTALTGAQTITISGISNKKAIYVLLHNFISTANAGSLIFVRPNNDSAANYIENRQYIVAATTYAVGNFNPDSKLAEQGMTVFQLGSSTAASTGMGSVFIDSADTTGWKRYETQGSGSSDSSSNGFWFAVTKGLWKATAAVTSISIFSSTGNFDAGTVYVYGAD